MITKEDAESKVSPLAKRVFTVVFVLVVAVLGYAILSGGGGDDGSDEASADRSAAGQSDRRPTTDDLDEGDYFEPSGTTGATTDADTEVPETTLDVAALNLDTAWQVCSNDPEQVYLEAGTRDPAAAAEWFAQGTTEEYRAQSEEGCLAGLLGEPNPATP